MFQLHDQKVFQQARALGWASIGIGLAEWFAPQALQSLMGIKNRPRHRGILRVLGLREVLQGVGILKEPCPNREMTAGLRARVAGDVLDTVMLGLASSKTKRPIGLAAVAAAVAAIGWFDLCCATKLERQNSAN